MLSLSDLAREAQREVTAGKRAEVTEESVSETLAALCQPRTPREIAPTA